MIQRILYLALVCLSMLLSNILYAQHDLMLLIKEDGQVEVNMRDASCMNYGTVRHNNIQLETIEAGKDGDIFLDIISAMGNTDMELSLSSEGYFFGFEFKDGDVSIKEGLLSTPVILDEFLRKYKSMDTFRVIRCKKTIVYKVNDTTVRTVLLSDNNFNLNGVVDILNANSNFYAGLDFNGTLSIE